MNPSEIITARARALAMLERAGIRLPSEERKRLDAVDFGLGELEKTGLQVFTYVNNERYCARELVFFPGQTCPQHKHPPIGSDLGKMETLYVRSGSVWAYIEGPVTGPIHAVLPPGSEAHYTVFHEVAVVPGHPLTIPNGKLHWFQGGPEGAVVLEVSSAARDALDLFTDPRIRR